MKARRGMRSVAIACAVAVGALGLGVGAASAQSGPIDPAVKNVKRVKEPKDCSNDPGRHGHRDQDRHDRPPHGPGFGQGFFPQIVDGVEARIIAANASRELGNRKITLVKVDDKGDTAQNLSAAQQLVEQDKVYAILPQSAAGTASAPYLNQKGIPVVGWQLGMDVFGKYPNFFGFQNANAADLKSNYTTRNGERRCRRSAPRRSRSSGRNQGNSAIFIEQIADGIKRVGKRHEGRATRPPTSRSAPPSSARTRSRSRTRAPTRMYTALATADEHRADQRAEAGERQRLAHRPPGRLRPSGPGIPAFDGTYLGIEFKPLETTPAPRASRTSRPRWRSTSPTTTVNQSAAVGWLSANTLIEGIKAAGVNCPTTEGFINNLRLDEGLHGRRLLRPDRLPGSVQQAVPVRVLRAGRGREVHAGLRRQAGLR